MAPSILAYEKQTILGLSFLARDGRRYAAAVVEAQKIVLTTVCYRPADVPETLPMGTYGGIAVQGLTSQKLEIYDMTMVLALGSNLDSLLADWLFPKNYILPASLAVDNLGLKLRLIVICCVCIPDAMEVQVIGRNPFPEDQSLRVQIEDGRDADRLLPRRLLRRRWLARRETFAT